MISHQKNFILCFAAEGTMIEKEHVWIESVKSLHVTNNTPKAKNTDSVLFRIWSTNTVQNEQDE